MPRPRKVPANNIDRSVLFRVEQIQALEAAAAGLGVETSDLIRAAVDVLFPAPTPNAGYAARIRIRAALELRRREIAHRPGLVEAVLAAWTAGDPRRVVGVAGRIASATARAVVAMLEAFFPAKDGALPADPSTLWNRLTKDWAGQSKDAILQVLASPAVWAWGVDEGGRIGPWSLLAARPVSAWVERQGGEDQHRRAATALATLVKAEVLTPFGPAQQWPLAYPFPVDGYQINWARLGPVELPAVPSTR